MRHFFKKSIRYGIPFLIFMITAPLGLKEFQDLRYRFKPFMENLNVREKIEKQGIEMKKPGEVTLESEYEKVKDQKFDDWENVRVPRPWEEGPIDK